MNSQKVDPDRERYERWRTEIRDQYRYVKAQEAKFSSRLPVPYDCDTCSRWMEVLGLVDEESFAFEDWVELDVDANGSVWFVRRCD